MSKKPSRHMVQRAVAVLVALLLGVFGMDVASLVRIQLIQADEYRSKAESQQLSDTEIQPQRGLIYDRNKKVLAQSANVWLVYINPSKIPNDKVREAISEGLAEILEMDKETILKKNAEIQLRLCSGEKTGREGNEGCGQRFYFQAR